MQPDGSAALGDLGRECTARLRELLPKAQILVVTVYTDNGKLFEALKAGASGYLFEHEDLVRPIRQVVAGGAPMSGSVARRVIEAFRTTLESGGLTHL